MTSQLHHLPATNRPGEHGTHPRPYLDVSPVLPLRQDMATQATGEHRRAVVGEHEWIVDMAASAAAVEAFLRWAGGG